MRRNNVLRSVLSSLFVALFIAPDHWAQYNLISGYGAEHSDRE
jgi:hypothetical protein